MGVAETKRRHEDTDTGREVNREGKRRNLQQRESERQRERGTGNRGRERELLNSQ